MNCRLCGQPGAGSSKLCVDCDAALRRARKGSTVSGNSPLRRAGGDEAVSRTIDLPPRPVRAAACFASRRLVVWAACGLVVTAGVYFGEHGLAPRMPAASALETEGVARQAGVGPAVASSSATLPQPTIRPEAPEKRVEVVVPTPPPRSALPMAGPQGPGPKPATAAAVRTSPAPNPVAGAAPDTAAGGTAHRSPDPASRPDEPPPITLASAPSRQPVSSADRWKGLANAVAKCGEKGGFAGMICEQKVRIEYCEGAWEQVPECSRPQRDQH
jgi:hypothetical protein